MKKVLSIVLVFTMILLMGAAAMAEDAPLKCYSFGVMSGGPAWAPYQRGFADACAELGWDGQYLCPTTDNNMSELFNLHDTAISNGADVMICCVTDRDAMSDILQKAVDQGITLVCTNEPDPHIPVMIGTDTVNLGNRVAEALVACMGDKEIHVVTMQTILTNKGQTDEVNAFEAKLHELRPDVEIVRREECNSFRPDLSGQAVRDLPGEP